MTVINNFIRAFSTTHYKVVIFDNAVALCSSSCTISLKKYGIQSHFRFSSSTQPNLGSCAEARFCGLYCDNGAQRLNMQNCRCIYTNISICTSLRIYILELLSIFLFRCLQIYRKWLNG